MIRPATELLKKRGQEVGAVVFLMAIALVLPGVLAIMAVMTNSASQSWLSTYRPIVYMTPDATADQIKAMRQDIAAIDGVGEVVVRTPEQAHKALSTRLGAERVNHLGVQAAMLPTSLIVEPKVPLHGHIALVSTIGAMETREVVASVDIPGAQALELVRMARSAVGVILGLAAVLLVVSLVLLIALLRRVLEDERRELELLELFGASPMELMRPTMIRGAILGLWSGGVGSLCLLAMQLLTQRYALLFVGPGPAYQGVTWAIVVAPVVILPTLGVLVGWWSATQRAHARQDVLPEISPMLQFGARATAL